MEENKLRVVDKKESKKDAPVAHKLSYDELESAAHQMSEQTRQLFMQNQQLRESLQAADLTNYFKRLDYLWTVITSTTPYITEEFKVACGEEYMSMMSSSAEEDAPEDTKVEE